MAQIDGHDSLAEEKGKGPQALWPETLALLQLAAPAVVQLCTMQALVVTNQVIVGHLGAKQLAAAALGITVGPCSHLCAAASPGVAFRICSWICLRVPSLIYSFKKLEATYLLSRAA